MHAGGGRLADRDRRGAAFIHRRSRNGDRRLFSDELGEIIPRGHHEADRESPIDDCEPWGARSGRRRLRAPSGLKRDRLAHGRRANPERTARDSWERARSSGHGTAGERSRKKARREVAVGATAAGRGAGEAERSKGRSEGWRVPFVNSSEGGASCESERPPAVPGFVKPIAASDGTEASSKLEALGAAGNGRGSVVAADPAGNSKTVGAGAAGAKESGVSGAIGVVGTGGSASGGGAAPAFGGRAIDVLVSGITCRTSS